MIKIDLKGRIDKIPKGTKFFCMAFLIAVFIIFVMAMIGSKGRGRIESRGNITAPATESGAGLGVFTGDRDTSQKAYVERMDKQYYEIQKELEERKKEIITIKKDLKNIAEKNKLIDEKLSSLNKSISEAVEKGMGKIDERLKAILPPGEGGRDFGIPSAPGLTIYHAGVKEEGKTSKGKIKRKAKRGKYVYLPMGSFVKGTLLTGVYAPADTSNPLPVLVSIDEAFWGPSMSRIPLKGCFAVGKAIADINSRRAIIQIVGLSYVFSDGKVFESPGDLGYLTGKDGVLGIPGKLIRRTGAELAGAFASGFLSGAAEALGAEELTTTIEGSTATSVVTGSLGKYAGYSGLSNAAAKMAEYYSKQLEKITTAVQIPMGKRVYMVMQKGVEIEGLTHKEVVTTGISGLD